MTQPFDFTTLACPMPDCTAALALEHSQSYTLSVGDIAAGEEVPATDWPHAATWQIGCTDGHVLLLPGRVGCPCKEDQGGDTCPHNQDDYDSSDDYRRFRPHDLDRLRAVLALIGGGAR